MSSWLWMSFATSYSSDESLPLLIAFDEASPNCKAVQRCFTVEEVRNEEVHCKCYTKRVWTDFVNMVVAAGQNSYEEAKAAGTVNTYEPPVFHPQGCAPSCLSFPPGNTDVVFLIRKFDNACCMTDAYTDQQARAASHSRKSGQSHAVAIDCARRLIFNHCVEHASTLDAKNLAAQGIPDTKEAIDLAKLVSKAL
eukprot:g15811.t1